MIDFEDVNNYNLLQPKILSKAELEKNYNAEISNIQIINNEILQLESKTDVLKKNADAYELIKNLLGKNTLRESTKEYIGQVEKEPSTKEIIEALKNNIQDYIRENRITMALKTLEKWAELFYQDEDEFAEKGNEISNFWRRFNAIKKSIDKDETEENKLTFAILSFLK